jgi:hypothetical protein
LSVGDYRVEGGSSHRGKSRAFTCAPQTEKKNRKRA